MMSFIGFVRGGLREQRLRFEGGGGAQKAVWRRCEKAVFVLH